MASVKGTQETKKSGGRPVKAKPGGRATAEPKVVAKKSNAKASAPQPAKRTPTMNKPKGRTTRQNVITSEERQRMIAEAAYYLAEKRGFQGGSSQQDWFEAAAQIDRVIINNDSNKD